MRSLLRKEEHLCVHQKKIAEILQEHWEESRDDGYDFSKTRLPFASVSAEVNRNPKIFFRPKKAHIALREREKEINEKYGKIDQSEVKDQDSEDDSKILTPFGILWERSLINNSRSRLLGVQMKGTKPIDFAKQTGIYILYDHRNIVYIGQSKGNLGQRIKWHTKDRLRRRWDRFSWFGILPVTQDGKLGTTENRLIQTMPDFLESFAIKLTNPPENRTQGNVRLTDDLELFIPLQQLGG